jgi:hypothetical protein
MPFTAPPTAVTGAIITAADINVFRDNDNWFNALVPAPTGAGQLLRSISTSSAGFVNGGAGSGIDADLVDGQHASALLARANHTGTQAPSTISPQGAGSGLDADLLDGQQASAIIAAAFPSGLGGWVRKASEIPSGFARETALDGRVPIGAGTTAGVTFVEETNYGSSWGHQHQNGWHLHYAAELGIAGQTSTPTENEAAGVSGGLVAADGHKHNAGSLDVTGTTGYSGGEDTTSTTWIFPSRAVVWVRKS